ncbi:SacI homology domain-containing protein [Cladochytrium replicatum]|nr:SacI homology domain-containing protein [Cladochytrium replicatum]
MSTIPRIGLLWRHGAIMLRASKIALVLAAAPNDSSPAHAAFIPTSAADSASYSLSRQIYALVGLAQYDDELYLGVITEADVVGELESSPIYRVRSCTFIPLRRACADFSALDFDSKQHQQPEDPNSSNPIQSLSRLLSSGTFYFSPSFDLFRSAQLRFTSDHHTPALTSDSTSDSVSSSRFIWNKHILSPLLAIRDHELDVEAQSDLDESGLMVGLMQGFVGVALVSLRSESVVGTTVARVAVISRLSCRRAGTRFKSRGLDDYGNVANFAETEVMVYNKSQLFSFVELRGSVPAFWEQRGLQVVHKIDLTRGSELTYPAFTKHFQDLIDNYGKVNVVNLLSNREDSPEYELSQQFREHTVRLSHALAPDNLRYTSFDFHSVVNRTNFDRLSALVDVTRGSMDDYGYFVYDTAAKTPVTVQEGVFRTNCLDCLDRTNYAQMVLAKDVLRAYLTSCGYGDVTTDGYYTQQINALWADNGDALSKISAGTGALKTSFARKGKQTMLGNITGILDDAAKSVNRFYASNFQDSQKQETISFLLGNVGRNEVTLLWNTMNLKSGPGTDNRSNEFLRREKMSVWMGTWNVNGVLPTGKDNASINAWLFDGLEEPPHMYVFGVQEMIQLTAGQVITADTDSLRQKWDSILLQAVNRNPYEVEYVELRSLHLVALAIFVYVRVDSIPHVRNVEYAKEKTGLGGMAGNKGGIGVSLKYHDTRILFVTAHLAAGNSNVNERNRDYTTITNGLNFQGRPTSDHDVIFWLGDFNYRTNLPNDEVRELLEVGDTETMLSYDQLQLSQAAGEAFVGFTEGQIHFFPTYKYDHNTDDYDTSEKARTPSWTDRILYKGQELRQRRYERAEIKISDHRPVFSVFDINVAIVDVQKKNAIEREARNRTMSARSGRSSPMSATNGGGAANRVPTGNLIDLEEATVVTSDTVPRKSFDSFGSGNEHLPPPSSETSKWWETKVDEAWWTRPTAARNPFG